MKDRNKIMRFFGLHPQNDVRRRFAFTLAEGATHVDNSNNKRRFAFTLAEVLVTLGIIGVVAVLTVPNVISSYQKKVYVTQLQKGYAQLQQAFSLAMADDEVEDMRDTTLMNNYPNGNFSAYISHDYTSFLNELKKYIKFSKFCLPVEEPVVDGCFNVKYSNLSGSYSDYYMLGRLKIYTSNGITYYFNCLNTPENASSSYHKYDTYGYRGSIDIDVNGDKKPNKFGRDLFTVALLFDGSLIFQGSQQWATGGVWSLWSKTSDGSCLIGSEYDSKYYGDYCGGRIFDNGWVMDY